jgi:hypothetical protein
MGNENKISDVLEIQALKARYARFGDTKNWIEFRRCFADDFYCMVTGAPRASASDPDSYEVRGAEEFVLNARRIVSDIQPIHQLSLPEITTTKDNRASGTWALHDYLVMPHCIFRGWGHYHDDYVKIDGEWKIEKSVVSRIRVEEIWL